MPLPSGRNEGCNGCFITLGRYGRRHLVCIDSSSPGIANTGQAGVALLHRRREDQYEDQYATRIRDLVYSLHNDRAIASDTSTRRSSIARHSSPAAPASPPPRLLAIRAKITAELMTLSSVRQSRQCPAKAKRQAHALTASCSTV